MQSRELERQKQPVTTSIRRADKEDEASDPNAVLARQAEPVCPATSDQDPDPLAIRQTAGLNQTAKTNPAHSQHMLLKLQREYGNHHVQRIVDLARIDNDKKKTATETRTLPLPAENFAPLPHQARVKRSNSVLQRWGAGDHKEITHHVVNKIIGNFSGLEISKSAFNTLANASTAMDMKIHELLFNIGGFLIGLNLSGNSQLRVHQKLVQHYRDNQQNAQNHGEGGLYDYSTQQAAKINEEHQRSIEDNARRSFSAIFREFTSMEECQRTKNAARHTTFELLGDAFHVAQDRGAHGEGGWNMGHDRVIWEPDFNPDSPTSNADGYKKAIQNSELVALRNFDVLLKLLDDNFFRQCSYTSSGPIKTRLQEQRGDDNDSTGVTGSNSLLSLDVEDAIQQARGSGQILESKVRKQMEPAFGIDFSDVHVHTDADADILNRAVSARAFTVGQDIFFRNGEYNPGTSTGRALLVHELTHVVQQSGEIKHALAISQPGDVYELEADEMARSMLRQEHQYDGKQESLHKTLQVREMSTQPQTALMAQEGEKSLPVTPAFSPPDSIAINYELPLVPQPTKTSCWAASLAMIVGFRDRRTYSAEEIASKANMSINAGYGWSAIQTAISVWNLTEIAPMSANPNYWSSLLDAHGPLWIVEVGAPYHAVAVRGMYGTGSPEATEVWINNPWPPNQGLVEYKTFTDFDREFGLGVKARAAIVHA